MKNGISGFLLIALFVFSGHAWANIPNLRTVTEQIYRGGRPQNVADIERLKQMGVRTVINLENVPNVVSREKAWVENAGLEFISVPMTVYQSPADADINRLEGLLQNTQKLPIFIHCMHGRDRTGVVLAIYRVEAQHWSAGQAYNEMLSLGFDTQYSQLVDYFRERTSNN